ncbi:MAG: hypothetical protein TYPL_2750 [Candidatus Tyloplasma litorale]|nr:MAG: hypothetical protein TYPL_2750 [Mycoplasmatales bacterium]
MIKVDILKSNNKIKEFSIKGHANAKIGNSKFDLVCAGVSSVVYGILNSLELDFLNIEIKNGYVNIIVNSFSNKNEIILNTLEISLKTIEENNEKHIKIKEI